MNDSKPVIDFIFRITNEVLWNTFKKNEIGDVMLPFVVLRRMDCRLEDKKENVRNTYLNFKDKVNPDKLDPILRKAAGGLRPESSTPARRRGSGRDTGRRLPRAGPG